MSINRFFVGGYVGTEPKVFETKNNEKCIGFSFAEHGGLDENGEQKTYWHQVSVGGKLVETIEKYVKKGDKLVIEGRVTADAYISKDNKPVSQLKIWMTGFEFASTKDNPMEKAPE